MKNLLINRALAAKTTKLFTLLLAVAAAINMDAEITTMTCKEAVEAAFSVSENNELYNEGREYTIEGYVIFIEKAFDATQKHISFWMADAADDGDVLEAFRAKCDSAEAAPAVGDKVAVTGRLTKYNDIPEIASGSTFVIVKKKNGLNANIDDLYYNLDTTNQVAEVANNSEASGDIIIPRSVTYESVSYIVKSIGSWAFDGCSSLTSVTIPNSVTSIGHSAFRGCSSLISVTIEAETPPTLLLIPRNRGDAFSNTNISHIYVPCEQLETYQTTKGWSGYASQIKYAPLPYEISTIAENGNVTTSDITTLTICDEEPFVTCTATANYGYHFAKWSDGNTENPRVIELTQDTTLEAEFAKNTYTISTISANPELGTTIGDTTALYLDEVEISAIPNYGYHFVKWDNSIPDNSITVADAIKATLELAENTPSSNQYIVVGYIVGKYGSYYNSYYIADTPDGESTFVIYRADNSASIGEKVMISGYLLNYYGTPEIMQGGKVQPVNHSTSTANPYTLTVTVNETYTATFAKDIFSITANAEHGSISGNSSAEYLDEVTLSVSSDYGYHFAQWSDGVTENPRTIILTQDTTFTAEFAKNSYTISTTSANLELGTTSGDTTALYLDEVEISAIPNYGYRFVRWNDGNTSNPRTVSVTEDKTYTATFAKNVYSITKNAEHGSISGNSSAEYLDFVTLTVTADYGYHFTQWSDGLKDNPRIFQITKDTTFTAEFAYDRVGTCGKDMALVWSYDPNAKVLTIGNAGEFTENMQFGAEAPAEMEELVIGNSVTAIGANAFAGIETLKQVSIGESVKTIGEQAFYNCVNLETIFNYRPTPTNAYSNAFDGVDKFECKLYVLPNSIDMYKNASVWRDFYYTYAIGAEEATVTTNDVKVEPQDNAATLTWPTSNNAVSYTIEITKDGVVFCRLTFNANGQLTGIAFAPGRDGQSMAPAALMTANGLQFTVTGLDSNTQYGYSLTAKDANEQPIATYSGSFTTTSEGVVTGIDNTPFLSGEGRGEASKLLRNGEVLILRDGKTYTIQGVEVK